MPPRIVDLTEGRAMIVTDLHGDWEAYSRYRARFFRLHEQGKVDRLILCGDLIHGDSAVHMDRSLEMILDVMRLQETYGPDAIMMLLGNHEMPHLYSIPLSRGEIDYTPRFEAALAAVGQETRNRLIAFLDGLPFCVRTKAGVMLNHAGAAAIATLPVNMERLAVFSHADLIARANAELAQYSREDLLAVYARTTGLDYDEQVRYYLAVTDSADPRYDHLLRLLILNTRQADFNLLWEAFFTRNERDVSEDVYWEVLKRFLSVWSEGAPAPQRVLVSGHMPVRGGYQLVAGRQLRIASGSHAIPRESGVYLLLDCADPVQTPAELIPHLGSVFAT